MVKFYKQRTNNKIISYHMEEFMKLFLILSLGVKIIIISSRITAAVGSTN